MNKITAKEGNVFQRIHDGMIFGNEIYLGIDYSTGEPREDKREYYEEIPEPEKTTGVNDSPDNWVEREQTIIEQKLSEYEQ